MDGISTNPINDFDAAVRHLSGGTNVAIYNDLDIPSIYVRRDKGLISQVIHGGPDITHYAFKVNGVEVPAFYMGKYLATVYKGRALSLPFQEPASGTIISENCGSAPNNLVNFDNAKIWCEANGAGFHLPTIAEYAWIALLSRMNDTMPRGNNYYGTDRYANYERSLGSTYNSAGKINKTLTGSGPATWNDNWQPDGICDLNGNVYEWQGGYRTVDGELQIFPDNDAALHADQTATSTLWKAILQDGTLVEPGTEGSLKWDYTADPEPNTANNAFCLNTKLEFPQKVQSPSGIMGIVSLSAADGVSVPDRLKALALMPDGNGTYKSSSLMMRGFGESIMARGGTWTTGGGSGIFFGDGSLYRRDASKNFGFRPAFIPGI